MVSMVNEERLKQMTPEQRVANGYESLYFGAESGDPEMNQILQATTQRAFAENDIALDESPDDEKLRRTFVKAYVDAAATLQGEPATDAQKAYLTRSFARFEMTHGQFYDRTAKAFENRHDGETLDLHTFIERERASEAHNAEEPDIDAMEREAAAGLSYGAKAETAVPVRQTYAEQVAASEVAREQEDIVAAQKGDHDTEYDAYSRGHDGEAKHRRYTAGDDFGFDEREDDGPDL